jgi:hypothetical protein
MKKLIAGALLLLSTGPALADTEQSGKIRRLIVELTYASIWLENAPTNDECKADERWVIDFSSDSVAREKFSTILSSANSRLPVRLHYLSSQGCGGFGAKKVHFVESQF